MKSSRSKKSSCLVNPPKAFAISAATEGFSAITKVLLPKVSELDEAGFLATIFYLICEFLFLLLPEEINLVWKFKHESKKNTD
jgi:hypothetical protein